MVDAPPVEFGVPWAAAGGASRRHTVLAWVNGFDGGALFVQRGSDARDRVWIMVREWADWVAATGAVPVGPSPVVVFEDDPAALVDAGS